MHGLAMIVGSEIFIKPEKGQTGWNQSGRLVETDGEQIFLVTSDLSVKVAKNINFVATHDFFLCTGYAEKEKALALALGGEVHTASAGRGENAIGTYKIVKKLILTPALQYNRVGWVADPKFQNIGEDIKIVDHNGVVGSLKTGVRGEEIRFDYSTMRGGAFIEEVFEVSRDGELLGHAVQKCFMKQRVLSKNLFGTCGWGFRFYAPDGRTYEM